MRVVRWEGEEGGKDGWKGGRMVRQKGGRYLVLYKMSPRFHLFVSDVNQGIKGVGWVHNFLAWLQE